MPINGPRHYEVIAIFSYNYCIPMIRNLVTLSYMIFTFTGANSFARLHKFMSYSILKSFNAVIGWNKLSALNHSDDMQNSE